MTNDNSEQDLTKRKGVLLKLSINPLEISRMTIDMVGGNLYAAVVLDHIREITTEKLGANILAESTCHALFDLPLLWTRSRITNEVFANTLMELEDMGFIADNTIEPEKYAWQLDNEKYKDVLWEISGNPAQNPFMD